MKEVVEKLPYLPVRINLSASQSLVVIRNSESALLELRNRQGQITLSIEVTESGPILRFEGSSLCLQTSGELSVEAERLSLHGRSGVSVTSEGDINLETTGDLNSTARIQNVTASLGNTNIKANDDVRLNGERVMVNC